MTLNYKGADNKNFLDFFFFWNMGIPIDAFMLFYITSFLKN